MKTEEELISTVIKVSVTFIGITSKNIKFCMSNDYFSWILRGINVEEALVFVWIVWTANAELLNCCVK